ncbi:MAG: RNA-binding protein [Planctomycetaceae bacterium]|nr:RNA-binding protein [Planctomycetaceae bacterium]
MGSKLYVGNLNYSTTEETLRAVFSQNGRNVQSVNILVDRETGRPRGFGFVELASADEARAAMEECNGLEVDGRPLRVNEAREREARGGGGGGGGRGGYGGGGGGYGGGGGGGRRERSQRDY